ncbi:TfpX/TfpZ family type IV pilin accessory protein [Delftia acidovorans]|jgi:hypothetical protein|uniref:TfpX/TfpZ family type IV pilin accessory protein n=1 Tax=Delftia acidovorans TaxID=80866 RepID=UPI002FDE6D26
MRSFFDSPISQLKLIQCIAQQEIMNSPQRWQATLRAVSIHFVASFIVAALVAALVFNLWFPYPYRELAGGRELFWLIIGVDVVCGPLLTAVLFNSRKPRRELMLDLGFVALIQFSALIYGLHTLSQARPVYLVFEVDRFRVVTVADVDSKSLHLEQGGLHALPWAGPRIIGTRAPHNNKEYIDSLDMSLGGLDPSMRPDWWQPYEKNKPDALKRAQKMEALRNKHPSQKALIEKAVRDSGLSEASLAWLPVTSFLSTAWVALIDNQTAEVKAFAPLDGF